MKEEDLKYFYKRFMDEMVGPIHLTDLPINEITCYHAALAFLAHCAKLKCLGRAEDLAILECWKGMKIRGYKMISLYEMAEKIIKLNDEYWEFDFIGLILRDTKKWRGMSEEKLEKCGWNVTKLGLASSTILVQVLRLCVVRTVLSLFPHGMSRDKWDDLVVKMTEPKEFGDFVAQMIILCDDFVLLSDDLNEFVCEYVEVKDVTPVIGGMWNVMGYLYDRVVG